MQEDDDNGPKEVNIADGDSDSERMEDLEPVTSATSAPTIQAAPTYLLAPVSIASSPETQVSGDPPAESTAASVPPGFRAAA